MNILKSNYHGGMWNNINVVSLPVKELWASVPKAEVHRGKKFFEPVKKDIEENGLNFPLLVVHSTYTQLVEQKERYKESMLALPEETDEKIHVVWGGSNRWHIANELGYEYVDCVLFKNGEFDQARKMQNLHRKPYQGIFY